jgi:hypothetical protein
MLMTMGHAGYMLAVGVAISELGAAQRARAVTRAAQQAQTVLSMVLRSWHGRENRHGL